MKAAVRFAYTFVLRRGGLLPLSVNVMDGFGPQGFAERHAWDLDKADTKKQREGINRERWLVRSACRDCGVDVIRWTRSESGAIASVRNRRLCRDCMVARGRDSRRQRAGDRKVDSNGYVQIRVNGQFVAEHRVVMERIIGRPLAKGESVHHKNGKRADNRPSNLELWVGPPRYGQRVEDFFLDYAWGLPPAKRSALIERIKAGRKARPA